MSYEEEQARLQRLIGGIDPYVAEYDDDDDDEEVDYIETFDDNTDTEQELEDEIKAGPSTEARQFHDNTDTEQELEDEIKEQELEDEIKAGPSTEARQFQGPLFLGRDQKPKRKKHIPPRNVRARAENIIKILPGVKGQARILKSEIDTSKPRREFLENLSFSLVRMRIKLNTHS
ncbi:hypothetical protein QE152_g7800 [Popillia japonica]|uniref:Uncharacterized protein n=1 Tax=Popillia japonica TaxID=7064 RepID=A0AAW1MEP8_POPJA